MNPLPPALPRFRPALRALARLAEEERYRAAFVFGSVARGDAGERSDLDARVVVADGETCPAINHPVIGGVKLDLTFESIAQLRSGTDTELARAERVPMIAESVVLFDKDGELTALRERAARARPRPVAPHEEKHLQFLVYHANEKAERNLAADPATALLVLHTSLTDLLNIHCRIRGRWKVSNKRMLADLRAWDAPLVELVKRFVSTADVEEKFSTWSAIVDHVVQPLGGRLPIAENNCPCAACQRNLTVLAGVPEG